MKKNNECYIFFNNLKFRLDKDLKEIAEELDIVYNTMYYSFKNNRISYKLSNLIKEKYGDQLTSELLNELNNLVLGTYDK